MANQCLGRSERLRARFTFFAFTPLKVAAILHPDRRTGTRTYTDAVGCAWLRALSPPPISLAVSRHQLGFDGPLWRQAGRTQQDRQR